MASTLVLAVVAPAIQAALLAASGVTALVSTRIYDDVQQRPVYPFVLVESGGEAPFNTLGPSSGLKWGGIARVDVRVVSQFRGESEGLAILSAIKQALDGTLLTVTGYGRTTVTAEPLVPVGVSDVAGVKTREWVLPFSVTAHQS